METINIQLFEELYVAIEARLRHIANIKHHHVFSLRNQIEIDHDEIYLITEDYWGNETDTDHFSIKTSEINEPDEYFIAQYDEEQRIIHEETEAKRLQSEKLTEEYERKELERLQKKFGSSI